jgi:predicted RNA-binding protein
MRGDVVFLRKEGTDVTLKDNMGEKSEMGYDAILTMILI